MDEKRFQSSRVFAFGRHIPPTAGGEDLRFTFERERDRLEAVDTKPYWQQERRGLAYETNI